MLPTPLIRACNQILSPAGQNARLSILIYHRVLPAPDPIFPNEVTAERFDRQLDLLKRAFNVLPLPEAIERLKSGHLPARAACITFDDGYADNVTQALPLLKKHGLPATFFIATAYLNGGRMFNDTVIEAVRQSELASIDLTDLGLGRHDLSSPAAKHKAIDTLLPKVKYLPLEQRSQTVASLAQRLTDRPLPDQLMMTTAQLKTLHGAGMEIGGHTHAHPILAGLTDAETRIEISQGLEELENLLGTRPRVFAYPNGRPGTDYRPEQATLLKPLGLMGAVSTHWGVARRDSDVYQLPRFTPWHPSHRRFLPLLLGNLRLTR